MIQSFHHCQDFHEHTTLYDMQYADFLAEKGAK